MIAKKFLKLLFQSSASFNFALCELYGTIFPERVKSENRDAKVSQENTGATVRMKDKQNARLKGKEGDLDFDLDHYNLDGYQCKNCAIFQESALYIHLRDLGTKIYDPCWSW